MRIANLALVILLFCSLCRGDVVPISRMHSWSDVGIEGGVQTYTNVFCNVRVSIPGTNILAVGDGVADDSPAIQAAINLCPSSQVVYVPAGRYKISSGLSLGTTRRCVIRGDGPGITIFDGYISFVASTAALVSSLGVVSGWTVGSTNIIVDPVGLSTSQVKPGWLVELRTSGDTNVNGTGYEGFWYADPAGQTIELQTVDAGRTNWTFKPPLVIDGGIRQYARLQYSSASGPNFVTNCGLENFTLRHDNSSSYAITWNGVSRCWASNIEVTNSKVAAFIMYRGYRCQITGSTFRNSTLFGSGGGYGILLQNKCTKNLIDNNIISKHAGSILVDDGAMGNVISYNYVADHQYYQTNWLIPTLQSHSAHPMFNLFEGNISPNLFFDDIHGSGAYQTAFRNFADGYGGPWINRQQFAVAVDGWHRFHSFVGNVLGFVGTSAYQQTNNEISFSRSVVWSLGYVNSTNYDQTTIDTLYRHGNYDTVTADVVWDGSNADHTIPSSLYLNSAPSWWGSQRWPPIGADRSPMVGRTPAYDRWNGFVSTARKLKVRLR